MAKYSNDKDINLLVKNIIKQGFKVKNGGKHLCIVFSTRKKLTIPSTPSDRRAYDNFKNQVYKYVSGDIFYAN